MKETSKQKEKLILNAASRLIVHYGYDKTTVADIAKEAGIGKGTVYLYFKSKDEIVESVTRREMYRHKLRWFNLVEADPEGGLLPNMFINEFLALSQSDLMKAIFKKDARIFGSYLKKEGSLLKSGSTNALRKELVQMLQDENCIRKDLDPDVVSHVMDLLVFSMVGIEDIENVEDMPDSDDVMRELAQMIHNSFSPKDGGDSKTGKLVLRRIIRQEN